MLRLTVLIASLTFLPMPSWTEEGGSKGSRPYIGIRYRGFSVTPPSIIVDKVVVNSPAYIAGIHAGDVIYTIDGTPAREGFFMQSLADAKKEDVGIHRATLFVGRGGNKTEIVCYVFMLPSAIIDYYNREVDKVQCEGVK